MSYCFGSFTGLFGSECQSVVTVLVSLVGIAGWGLYYAVPWVWRHTSFKYNFILSFIDHPPPKHTVHNYWFPPMSFSNNVRDHRPSKRPPALVKSSLERGPTSLVPSVPIRRVSI